MQLKKKEKHINLFFFFIIPIFVLIYILPSTVSVGDVAELVGASCSLGIAHAPGYPLFCIVYKTLTSIIPFGECGYKAALVSSLIYITCGFLIFLYSYKRYNLLFGIFIFTFFLSDKTLLKQSIIGEVFSLHNLLVVLIFYFLFSDNIVINKRIYIVGLLLGLNFGCQHIVIFLVPAVILYFIINNKNLNFKDILLSILFFTLGIVINIYIPIRSSVEPIYDWEDPQTIDRFLYLLLRKRYGSFSLAQGGKLHFGIKSLYYGFKLFFYILGIRNIIFLILSLLFILMKLKIEKDKVLKSVIVLISFVMSGPLLISISGLKNISETNIYILERLIVTSIISLIFLIIFTFSLLYNRKALLYLLIILNTFLFGKNLKDVSLRKNYFLYDYITNIFRNTPPNSILLSDRADETEFGLAYFQRCLKKRSDIEFIDCNASVSRSIYGNNYYKIWGETRLKIRNEVELKILSTSNKKIFYNTVLPQQTLTPKYKFGLLYKTSKDFNVEIPIEIFVIRNTDNLNIREFVLYNTYLNLLSNYYFDRSVELYDRKIWEVAKKLYIYLFLLNREYRYLTYIPYYYILKNELDNAEKEYLNIINKYELSDELKAEIFTNLAVVYERQNKIPLAIEYLLKVISLNPNYFQAYYNLASLYWRIGDFKKSLEIFEKLLYFKPNDEEVKRYIKYLKNKI